jgi:pyrroline-5-carboxylate reductase
LSEVRGVKEFSNDLKIGIIGTGKMGSALLSGLLRKGTVKRESLIASDVSSQRRSYVSKTFGIKCVSNNNIVVANSDIVIIAVEPKHVKVVVEDIKEGLTHQLLVSIAAGVSIGFLKQLLRRDLPIIRVMPNYPCIVGEGMIVVAPSPEVSKEGVTAVKEVFSSVGKVLVLDEKFLDAVTGLSGSGPAYIYLVIEGLIEGGMKLGLAEETALMLAAQTVLGSGRVVIETKMHPAKLRDMVTTPGGTTAEGLKELERSDVRAVFGRAVERAAKRSRELLN